MKTSTRLLLSTSLFLALVVGCSQKKTAPSTVSGTVKYKGQVVKGGNVSFYPKEGVPTHAPIRLDGSYLASQIPAGEMTVTVETESVKNKMDPSAYGGKDRGKGMMGPTPEGRGTGPKPEYVQIPAKYSDHKKTPLKTTLTTGKQTYDIDLTD